MSSSKKLTFKGTLRQVFICLRPPPLLGLCLGWSCNFAGSESGQIQSVNSCWRWSPTGLNTPNPLPPHTVFIQYIVQYFDTGRGKGVGVEPERRLEWQQFTNIYIVHRPAVEYCSTSYVEYCPPPSWRGILFSSPCRFWFTSWCGTQFTSWCGILFSSLCGILFTS